MECYSRLIFVTILAHSSLKLEGCATNCSGVPPKGYNICGGTDCSQYLDCVGSKQLMTCAPMFYGSWFDEFQQSCSFYSNTCPNFLPDPSGQWNSAPESSSSSSNGNVPMVSMFSWTPLQYSVPSEWLSGPVSASAGTPPGGPWSAAAPVNGGSGSSNSPNDISSAMHSALPSDVDYPDVVTTNDAGKALSDTSTPPYSTSSASSMETNPIGSTAAGASDSSSSGTFSTTVSGASAPTTSSSDMASSPPPPPPPTPPIVAWYVNARPAVDANATTATATDAVHAVACVRLCLLARWPPPPSPLCEAIAVENDRSPIDVRCFFYSKGWNDQPMVDDDSMTTYHVVRR